MVSILQVAKEAGVSPSTVSRTFTSPGLLKEETCSRVIETAKRLNYKPRHQRVTDSRIRSAKTKSKLSNSDTIGFQFFAYNELDLLQSNGFYGPVLAGAQAECAKLGMHLLLHATHRHQLLNQLPKMVEERAVSGMLLVGTADPKILAMFSEHIPNIVLVDNRDISGNHDCIIPDGFHGMYEAAKHLISRGHTKIGFYEDSTAPATFEDRLYGYLCAINDAGLTPAPRLIITSGVIEDRVNSICDYLSKKDRPSAIVAANDMLAFDVMEACHRMNINIPDELSVIGYDDIEFSALTRPALTTVRVEKEYLGRLGVRRLYYLMHRDHEAEANEPPIQLTIPVSLVHRQTCR